MKVTTVGLDLAKNVFQVHGIDDTGNVIVGRSLRRRQVMPFFDKLEPCLIGVEACGTSHFWARELEALGHEVKLKPPKYVKPYVKRGKTDAADAEAIAEAVRRPTMRFVAIKSAEQQSVVALHRTRDLLVGQRTQLVTRAGLHDKDLRAKDLAALGRRGFGYDLARRVIDTGDLDELEDEAGVR